MVPRIKLCEVTGHSAQLFCSPRCSASFLHQLPHPGDGIALYRCSVAEQADVKIKPCKLLNRAQRLPITGAAEAHGQGKAAGAVERVADKEQTFFLLRKN